MANSYSQISLADTLPAIAAPRDLAPLWWLWLPPLLLIVQLGVYMLDRPAYERWIDGELGLVELGTFAALLPGIALGILILLRRRVLPEPRLYLWVLLVTWGCFYFAGEEASWGQHLLGWETPEPVQDINDQQETNLHNVSSWFDQKPRLLLELWVVIGGLIIPIRNARRGIAYAPTDWRYWFWPTRVLVLPAALVVIAKLPEYLQDWFGIPRPPPLDIRVSETQEYYFGLYLTLYLASIYVRLRDWQVIAGDRSQG
ncbi:MAG: hypothetical protein M3Z21_00525 [Pseudomonadota bacterium]|nr:hypothetical protein [Pseudomonadota bacterium]